jgi:hypothetical protein
MRKFLFLLAGSLWMSLSASGQVTDTSTVAEYAMGSPLALYQSATRYSPHLYNGPRYHIYDSRSKEHQFFESEDWQTGSVFYDGQLYRNISLMYDIFKGYVVVRHPERSGLVQLQSERIREFTIANNRFIKIEKNEEKGADIPTGFYQLLYDGKTQVLARRVKERQEQIENNKITVYFPPKNFFYIKKDGVYHIIRSKKAALALFNDQKSALRKSLRESRINYRKSRDLALVQMATQYDKLRP